MTNDEEISDEPTDEELKRAFPNPGRGCSREALWRAWKRAGLELPDYEEGYPPEKVSYYITGGGITGGEPDG